MDARLLQALHALIFTEHVALVPSVLAEVVVDVVVEDRRVVAKEAGRQPVGEERHLAVAMPGAGAPGPSADAPDDLSEGILHAVRVHGRRVGPVPFFDVLVQEAALAVAAIPDRVLAVVAAHLAVGRDGHERLVHHPSGALRRGDLHRARGDVVVEPVGKGHGAAHARRLARERVHVPPGAQQGPGHGQHVGRLGEEVEGDHLAVELHQGLVLGVGHGAHLRPAAHDGASDVRERLVLVAPAHEVLEVVAALGAVALEPA
mmetsp:Transcript_26990/g.59374  ORF Transcript_26990/g.59374 Transcript_26990/m.59374 type:complete len:260 (+) Transcript_26990:1211-1990(+)